MTRTQLLLKKLRKCGLDESADKLEELNENCKDAGIEEY